MDETIRDGSAGLPDGGHSHGQSPGESRRYAFDQSGPDLDTRYAQVRREAPVARFRFPGGDVAWLVTGYEPARQVLSHPAFSRAAALGRMPAPLASKTNLMMLDPPEHTRLRRLIGGWFSARAIERLRPRIEQVTSMLLDEMAAHGPGADLVRHLSRPLALIVICELLGIPDADRDSFHAVVDRHQATTAYRPQEMAQAKADLDAYFLRLIGTLRQEPGSGLLGTLVKAHDTGKALSDAELVDLAVVLLNAGHLTTVSALTTLVYYLLTRPDDLHQISADPAHLPAAIEESLRFAPLGGTEDGLPWIATMDVDVGSERLREGDAVYVALRAANRDETIWPDGETLNFARGSTHPHMAFGYGIHHCIGAPLARAELLIASTTLLRRFAGLRLAVPREEIRWTEGRLIRRIAELPVVWDTCNPTSGE
jgi:nocardicin N-oxygenase